MKHFADDDKNRLLLSCAIGNAAAGVRSTISVKKKTNMVYTTHYIIARVITIILYTFNNINEFENTHI